MDRSEYSVLGRLDTPCPICVTPKARSIRGRPCLRQPARGRSAASVDSAKSVIGCAGMAKAFAAPGPSRSPSYRVMPPSAAPRSIP
jgi:hypothetical protein